MSFAAAVSIDVIAFQSIDDDKQVQHTMITIQHDVARLPVSAHENPQRDSFVAKANCPDSCMIGLQI